ncbi:MAG: hypothetical protein IPN36_02855 [Bacteroidetes bacterium]|nr:hypothetical protein [Bacteroidota bacterium]
MPRKIFNFQPGGIFHISNIGNNGEEIFSSRENYEFFLQKFSDSTCNIFEIIGYCLIPNQYHLLVAVKSIESIYTAYSLRKRIPIKMVALDEDEISIFLSQEVANVLNSYAKAYNRCYGRKGSLFRENFRKQPIREEELECIIAQFEYMPVNQGIVDIWEDWDYVSAKEKIDRKMGVIDWVKYGRFYADFKSVESKDDIKTNSVKIAIN